MSAFGDFTEIEYQEAKRLVLHHRHGSVSLLQRNMFLPYTKARFLADALTAEGVLTAPTKAGFRLLQPGHAQSRTFAASPQEKHVRLLRDLALYLLECEELRVGPDSRSTAMILHPLELSVKTLSAAAAGAERGQSPVFSTALALAKLPELAVKFAPEDVEVALRGSCAEFERRRVPGSLDPEERLLRGFVQLARYFEKRLFDGFGAHTRAFESFVPDALLPTGRSHAGGGHREHVVPCALLRDRCMELLQAGLPVTSAAEWMRPYLAIVMITPEEANTLDVGMGLKTCMPRAWRFDTDCIFERLHAAGITFDPPVGHALCLH